MKVERNERKTGEIHQMRGRIQFRDRNEQNNGSKKSWEVNLSRRGRLRGGNVTVVEN